LLIMYSSHLHHTELLQLIPCDTAALTHVLYFIMQKDKRMFSKTSSPYKTVEINNIQCATL